MANLKLLLIVDETVSDGGDFECFQRLVAFSLAYKEVRILCSLSAAL